MSEPLRFNGLGGESDFGGRGPKKGLHHARAPVRLLAAVGILASAAIATGGLVSVFSGEPAPPKSKAGPADPTAAAADTALELELRVHEAELAAARARAALRNARQLGRDERELESYERRLEQLGTNPFESLRRGFEAASDATRLEQERLGERQVDARQVDERERRSHLRTIASPSREL